MCGITGGTWTGPRLAIDADTLRRMTDVLRHRGPDDEGFHSSDLALRPGRPVCRAWPWGTGGWRSSTWPAGGSRSANENETVWVVFNGEIYNFPALRRRLEGRGHRFKTHGDTETLVHLYEDEGPEMVGLLDGMFAFALWDAERGLLLLARDRLGKKPLVYRHEPGRLLFASQLKGLLQVPGVSRHIDPQALDEYLTYQYVPHPRTIWQGIMQTAAGPPGRLSRRPAGNPTLLAARLPHRRAVAARASTPRGLRSQLTAAVEARLQSEVPLGGLSLRRRRFDDRRGPDAATHRRAAADVFHRLPRAGV